jgi:hypothetical protein
MTIAATGKQIDQLGYELYGLANKEVRIVEGECGECGGMRGRFPYFGESECQTMSDRREAVSDKR